MSIDRELLNAYVDGELDPSEAARVMDAIAENPQIARELSVLMRTKTTLADSIDIPDLRLPAAAPARVSSLRAAMAAMLVLSLAVAAALHVNGSRTVASPKTDWVVTAHRNWTSTQPNGGFTEAAGTARLEDFATGRVYVPDLISARLYIAHVGRQTGGKAGGALIVGYRGTRGCTVTLAVSQRIAGLDERIRPFGADVNGFAWRAGKFGYFVMAEGMPRERLAGIAEGIREASLRHLPLKPETQTALARSRAASPPCRA